MARVLPRRVVEHLERQVVGLRQAEFLTLIEVGRTGQGEQEQGGGAGPSQTEFGVERLVRSIEQPGAPVGAIGQSVAGGVADDVVVRERPGGGGPDTLGGFDGSVDGGAHLLGVPVAGQEVEVERLVVLVGAQVEREPIRMHPGLGHHHEVALLLSLGLIEDGPPFADDLVDAIAIPVGM